MTENKELELDKALTSGTRPEDPELASLYDSATSVKGSLPEQAPRSAMHKAMFAEAVGARRRRVSPLRFFVPVLASLVLLAAAGVTVLGRNAEPGDDLYSVRGALQAVGLADSPAEEAESCLADANGYLARAGALIDSEPGAARRLTFAAISELARARRLLRDESGSASAFSLISALEDRAVKLLVRIESQPPASSEGRGDDDSGPGEGDDDSSGPGSGDGRSGDDSSGPGGGDDSDGDDRSGRDGGDDDSSGSGSGDDDDSSGSGSGGDDKSGSGGDRSGSDSGSDSSGSGSDND